MEKDEMIDAISQMTDLLYQENIEYAYRILRIVLPELERLMSNVEDVSLRIELRDKLLEALQAMQDGDYILLADVFQYEIVQCIDKI